MDPNFSVIKGVDCIYDSLGCSTKSESNPVMNLLIRCNVRFIHKIRMYISIDAVEYSMAIFKQCNI